MTGTVYSLRGDQVQAELIRPLREGSNIWYVQFPDDVDKHGEPIERLRIRADL